MLNERYTKKQYMVAFVVTIIVLAFIRHVFDVHIPAFGKVEKPTLLSTEDSTTTTLANTPADSVSTTISDSLRAIEKLKEEEENRVKDLTANDEPRKTDLYRRSGRIWDYKECFPDSQDVHIRAARIYGITPVESDSDLRVLVKQHQLVGITNSPFYVVDSLYYSHPYLTPSAQELLNEIAVTFMDSLDSKGYDPYLPIVSSVLRTKSDVQRLTRRNSNAMEESCHEYGTTFDITHSRFMPLTGKMAALKGDEVRDNLERLKMVLGEVLYDMRAAGKCYVKHERKQRCFHITVRNGE